MSDWDNFIDELSNHQPVVRAAAKVQPRFVCGQCAGSGLWMGGRTNQHGNNKCLACRGLGYFTKSPHDRAKARAQVAARKEKVVADNRAASILAIGGEANFEIISKAGEWSEFARDMSAQIGSGKTISERQAVAVLNMVEKIKVRDEQRKAAVKAAEIEVDLSSIREMFDRAFANGHKKPAYRAEGLKITLASSGGRNAGALYVVVEDDDAYQGKIVDKTFHPLRGAVASTKDALLRIAKDPLEVAIAYGRRTGRCACCGKELTNQESIDLGIGPICRQKWF